MGLSRRARKWGRRLGRMWSSSPTPRPAGSSRVCRIEQMEPRRMLAASVVPIHIGAVYLEDASERDDVGDLIEITWDGGATGTQLTQVTINTDRGLDGSRTDGDPFFDTEAGGAGAYAPVPLTVVSSDGIDSVQVAVSDGGTLLTITAVGWDPGEKLVLSVDVDEQGFFSSDATAVDEGGEFQYSHLAGVFEAPNYYTATGTDQFYDSYDGKLNGSGLDLPNDSWNPPSPWTPPGANPGVVYTAGAIFQVEQAPLPTIEGTVYEDLDVDNPTTQDPGEPGLAGVELALYRWDGSQYVPTGTTTTTDANGHYEFHVQPGKYQIRETQPSGYLSVGARAGTVDGTTRGSVADVDTITEIEVTGSESSVRNDFGEVRPAGVSGYVYHDANNDGVFDTAETPIGQATVGLYDGQGSLLATTQTDASGSYSFTGLMPGVYSVREVQPSGYLDGKDTAGSAGGTVGNDQIGDIHLVAAQTETDYNFGELLPGSISGRVYADRDMNCAYDAGDPLLEGVTIHLLDASGKLVATTQTDANGEYAFTGLAPGTYRVVEEQPAGYDDGCDHVGSVGGELLAPDSIVKIALPSGVDAVRYDFSEVERMELEGYVYVDDNNDGIKAAGEAGIAGATLHLLDSSGKIVATTTTDDAGHYAFKNLQVGDYSIVEVQPDGYYDGKDTAGSLGGTPHNPNGDSITEIHGVPAAVGVAYNFGELRPGSISGHVHAETNGDCVQQPGEPSLAGVTVHLLDAKGNRIATTTTDANGNYRFDNLKPFETYGVEEIQPTGYLQGSDHVGSEGGANPADNFLTQIAIGSGTDAVEYNFCEMTPARISGYVFQDGAAILVVPGQGMPDVTTLRDGQLTADDTRLAGVTVHLLDASGALVATATTDANGYYEFNDLPYGEYTLVEVQPAGYIDSMDTPGSVGGTADPVGGDRIAQVHLKMGDNAVRYNFSEVAVTPWVPEDDPDPDPEPPPRELAILAPSPPPPIAPVAAAPPSTPSPIYGGGGMPLYSWHLSVVDAGRPRADQEGGLASTSQGPFTFVSATTWSRADMAQSRWRIGDGAVSGELLFGQANAIPVTGDFNGDGITEVGVFIDGQWFIDLNGNGAWDEGDVWYQLGDQGDQPVTGDWDGDGKTDIGIYGPLWPGDIPASLVEPGLPDAANPPTERPKNMPPKEEEATSGERLIQRTPQGKVRADLIDHVFLYGDPENRAVAGDWNGDGIATIGVFNSGHWRLDVNGNGHFDDDDAKFVFGQDGDLPVVGDFNGDGIDEVGVYRAGTFYLDSNGDGKQGPEDAVIEKGGPNDLPVAGDFNGDGVDEVGTYQPGAVPPPDHQTSL